MQLQWMGEYREIVEKLIHYCNVYASVYKKECITKSGVTHECTIAPTEMKLLDI